MQALKEKPLVWSMYEAICNDEEFSFVAPGFNSKVKTTKDELIVLVFPEDRITDPVLGIILSWSDLYMDPPAKGKQRFEFDASGQYGYLSVNRIGITFKVEEDGMEVEVIHPANGETVRTAKALWVDLQAAGEEFSLLDDIQSLYRSVSER